MNNSPEIKTDSKAVKWLDNFWYHYKWQTIGIVFAAFVLLVCVLQMCGKESVDVYVMYAGEDTFTDGEKLGNIKSALKSVLIVFTHYNILCFYILYYHLIKT